MSSSYFLASSRFKNISQFSVVTHKVEDAVIGGVSRAAKTIFRNIDKSNDDSRFLAGQLWVFKTILNSTYVALDDPTLALKERYLQLHSILKEQNFDVTAIDSFEASVNLLWAKHKNPKFECLLNISEKFTNKSSQMGLFGKFLFGNDPACINSTISSLSNYGLKFTNIDSARAVKNTAYEKIFISGAPMRSSTDLMKAIFYSGVSAEVNLILYEHESFYIPTRLELPISSGFQKTIQKFIPTKIQAPTASVDGDDLGLKSWVEDSFWSDIHGGSRTRVAQSVAAHYILFSGGEGAFMPVEGKVLHIVKKGKKITEEQCSYDLSYVDILDLAEGDYVLLRKNSSGFLFNEELDSTHDEENYEILDQITDWKNALGALLLTKDYSEIASLVRIKGVAITPEKLNNGKVLM